MEALEKDPAKTVPIALNRLKQKQETFIEKRDVLRKEWKEVCIKKWPKSLDHQLFNFKARDKKILNIKNF